jgi:hypothetical protein
MEIDIVFNIDYASDKDISPLYEDIPKYIEYIQVNDFEQFVRLVNLLQEETICFLWVHPSLSAKRVEGGYKSKIMTETVPELDRIGLSYTQITRSSGATAGGVYYDVSKMLDTKEKLKSYKASELKSILFPPKSASPVAANRLRLEKSIKEDIDKINERLSMLRQFLGEKYSLSQSFWFENLFEIEKELIKPIFGFPYWEFPLKVYSDYLNISNYTQALLAKEELNVPEIVRFDKNDNQWQIDFSFFDQVSQRFEVLDPSSYLEKLKVATTLYIIHEAIHKVHNLDCNTVNGIGNFPKIIEEADYQADAIAILTELSFYIYRNGGIEKTKPRDLINELCSLIELAIETTFSFNPLQDGLKLIQVRRVNRYLIWLFQYYKIDNYRMESSSSVELLLKILKDFASKPLIEITGPAIKPNKAFNRTFYELQNIIHKEEVGLLKINNQIVRMGELQSFDFQEFYTGISKSDFKIMKSFLEKLFTAYKSSIL